MKDASHDPAQRSSTGSEDAIAGISPATTAPRGPVTAPSRKPRIEVIRAEPAEASEQGSKEAEGRPHFKPLGREAQSRRHSGIVDARSDKSVASPAARDSSSRRRLGRLAILLAAALFLLVVVVAAFKAFSPVEKQAGSQDAAASEPTYRATTDRAPPELALPRRTDQPPATLEAGEITDEATAGRTPGGIQDGTRTASARAEGSDAAVRRSTLGVASSAQASYYDLQRRQKSEINQPTIASRRDEPIGRDGAPPVSEQNAAETVRAFYTALGAGDGASAAQLVIPGKRQIGPLSARELTRYYSTLRLPLRVSRLTVGGAGMVLVSYDYVLRDGRACEGRSAVRLVQSYSKTLIQSIRTEGPC